MKLQELRAGRNSQGRLRQALHEEGIRRAVAIMYGLSMADRRPVGIENSGNTCYCNAVVQILFTAEKFCMWFLQADARRLQPNPRSRFKGHLFTAWVKLLRQAFSRVPGGKPARPLNCTHLLALLRSQHPQFEINRQHDAHEFLRTLLDGLSADCNRIIKPRPRENLDDRRDESVEDSSERFWQSSLGEEQSLITDMFMGQQATRITCGTCRNVRHRFDPFLDLSIELDTPRASPFVTLDEILTASYVKGAVSSSLTQREMLVREYLSKNPRESSLWSLCWLTLPFFLCLRNTESLTVRSARGVGGQRSVSCCGAFQQNTWSYTSNDLDGTTLWPRSAALMTTLIFQKMGFSIWGPSALFLVRLNPILWFVWIAALSHRITRGYAFRECIVMRFNFGVFFVAHASIQDSVFVLEGIVCQSGTIDSGHYTA